MRGELGPKELQNYLAFAEDLARAARGLILERIEEDRAYRLKADGSFVTNIDFAVEDLLRAKLHEAFPEHGIIGEERQSTGSPDAYQWILDPIDGTRSLRHRIPLFGTLIALTHHGDPVVGIIDLPMLERMYSGARGLGAYCDGRRLTLNDLSDAGAIAGEVIATGERQQFAACGQSEGFDRLMQIHPSVRTYCDCFGHALAIEGAAGAMVDYNLHLWDFAPSEVLTREAGGRFIRTEASSRSGRAGGHYDVIFGRPTVVEWVEGVLRNPA